MLTANYHIHTRYSPCADRNMTFEAVLDAAEEAGLTRIGVSDHCYSFELNSLRIKSLREELEQAARERSIQACLGVEAYLLSHRSASIHANVAGLFEYVLMAPNHYHIRGVDRPISLEPRLLADHELYMFESAANNPATDVVAHPFRLSPRVYRMEPDRLAQLSNDMMEALDQKRLAETLDRMREREVAVELNAGALETAGGSLDRFYRLCIERGTMIAFGTDAHSLNEIAPTAETARYVESLNAPAELVWQPFPYQ